MQLPVNLGAIFRLRRSFLITGVCLHNSASRPLDLTQLTPADCLRPSYRADRRFVPMFATFSQSFISGMTPIGARYATRFEHHCALWKTLLTMLRRQRAVPRVSDSLLETQIWHLEG